MSEYVSYKQCRLFHPETKQIDTAWIPNQYAQKGKHLRIKGEPGWVVEEVYASTQRNTVEMILARDALKRFQDVLRR